MNPEDKAEGLIEELVSTTSNMLMLAKEKGVISIMPSEGFVRSYVRRVVTSKKIET